MMTIKPRLMISMRLLPVRKIKLMRLINRLLNCSSSGMIIKHSRKQKFLRLLRKTSFSRRVKTPLKRWKPKRSRKKKTKS